MGTRICFMAGVSAERGWRYVIPFLQSEAEPSYYELLGNTATGPDYTWQDEVDGLERALPAGTQTHLVGFSGGATLALAFVADHRERVASLCLIEPAWSYLPLTEIEADYYERLAEALQGPASGERDAFRRLLVSPQVELGPARVDLVEAAVDREAAGQPTALRTMTEAMQRHRVDAGAFAGFRGRAFIGIGGLSHPMWHAQAAGLAAAFPVSRLEIFEERHHLDPPQKSETRRLVADLRWAWGLGTAFA